MKESASNQKLTIGLSADEFSTCKKAAGALGQPVGAWAKKVLLDVAELDIEQAETPEPHAVENEDDADRFFRPLTKEIVVSQLTRMRENWYNPDDREFDLEDEFEDWLMDKVIAAIDRDGLNFSRR